MARRQADAIIVGAGPAGCAAALTLAEKGYAVVLFERLPLPQVKTCGDALLPDALRALERFGLANEVRAAGLSLDRVRMTAPNGLEVDLAVPSVTLQRSCLHALLHARLRACGVELCRGEVLEAMRDSGELCGVRFRGDAGIVSLRAPLVLLASGARPETLRRFDLCLRERPSAVAIRAYYRDRNHPVDDALRISWDPAVAPGFGWVFPLPEQLYSIGCGHFLAPGEAPEQLYLRNRLEYLTRSFPPARRVAAEEEMIDTPCSSVLRTGLSGAQLSANGLLVTGEAAGSSSPLLGDGIGKAFATGELAGEVAAEALAAKRLDGQFLARYEERLTTHFAEYYRSRSTAQKWLRSPGHLDTLVQKAARKAQFRAGLEAVVNEDLAPTKIVSFWTFLFT